MESIKFENKLIDSLTPYDRNTRAHGDEDVNQIMISIQRYGFNDPVGIWGENNIIVEGHGRVLAAKRLGMDIVPCIRLDHLTDEQRREYAIMHNKTAELSAWDFGALEAELDELDLSAFDVDFGLDAEEDAEPERETVDIKEDTFQIVIDCSDEIDCEQKYSKLTEMGIQCRIST